MPSSSSTEQQHSQTLSAGHLAYCFDVLSSHLHGTRPADPDFPAADESFPLFVTWNSYSSSAAMDKPNGSKRLRGCIGTFEPLPLEQGLREYAITSAVRDHRFNPITLQELPRLGCAISLLTGFEECDDYLDWNIGEHGIYIHLTLPLPVDSTATGISGSRSSSGGGGRARTLTATYLPDVIPEQGWTKDEAIESAIRKAGWSGKINEDVKRSLRVRRYRSEHLSMTYNEWKASASS